MCANFFTNAEIEDARVLLCAMKRLTKHKGSDDDKRKRTVSDIVRLCLDLSVKFPVFYSVSMSRTPPVGIEHIDVSAFLQEVSALRAELRSLAAARSEIFDIRNSVLCMQNTTSAASAVISHTQRYQGPSTASNLPAKSVSNTLVEVPADDAVDADQHFNDVASDDVGIKEGISSFYQVARKLQSTGMTEKTR